MGQALKLREPRQNVMISARMRAGTSWSDACILNLSTRGMLVRAHGAPERGSYLEIRRGAYVIVARVVWSKSDRFGVQTQDAVPADGLVHDPQGAAPPKKPGGEALADRRARPRQAAARHEASRVRGRAMEFGTLIALGLVAAIFIGEAVSGVLARPLAMVGASLGPSRAD